MLKMISLPYALKSPLTAVIATMFMLGHLRERLAAILINIAANRSLKCPSMNIVAITAVRGDFNAYGKLIIFSIFNVIEDVYKLSISTLRSSYVAYLWDFSKYLAKYLLKSQR